MVSTSSAISRVESSGRHCHELLDDLEHQGEPEVLSSVIQGAPAQLGEHGSDAAPLAVVSNNESCHPPVDTLDLVNVLGIIGVPCKCAVFNSAVDERFIGDGLGLLGTVFEIPSNEVEGVAGFLRDGTYLSFPE